MAKKSPVLFARVDVRPPELEELIRRAQAWVKREEEELRRARKALEALLRL